MVDRQDQVDLVKPRPFPVELHRRKTVGESFQIIRALGDGIRGNEKDDVSRTRHVWEILVCGQLMRIADDFTGDVVEDDDEALRTLSPAP